LKLGHYLGLAFINSRLNKLVHWILIGLL